MSSQHEIELLLGGRHPDPHQLLGPHRSEGNLRLRVWRPGATSVTARILPADPGHRPVAVPLEQIRAEGLFEAVLPESLEGAPAASGEPAESLGGAHAASGEPAESLTGARAASGEPAESLEGARAPGEPVALPLDYELEVDYPGGASVRLRDPYAFAPTLGELDLHLAGEGQLEDLPQRLGAHLHESLGIAGVRFAVWAPNARAVSVVGDFNHWDGRIHPMRVLGSSGIWEIFLPGVERGERYKFELRTGEGELRLKADPLALEAEPPPATASVVSSSSYRFHDEQWAQRRAAQNPLEGPLTIYEVHLDSWRRAAGGARLGVAELASQLAAYVLELGFTHVELLPIMAHPFSGSWGYQVTSYYAPSPRLGSPDEIRALIDGLHAAGIGVILDWVPAHFPRDDWALARFDGTALYEHADPRRGAQPDWGTLVFNLARHEVRNFLLADALFWLRDYHADGLRVDAVASMLYRDYSRREGEWIPNEYGGREDLDAVAFLQDLNRLIHERIPGVISAAEESTAWPAVSRPTYVGGLGFTFKWNMGWMHDTLEYFSEDPVHRRYRHHELTFSLLYAFTENFILPLSHDEVVHGKGSLLARMPGDRWQRFANLRALYGYMWAHPGKKLLFMGQEFAQEREWNHEFSLDWHLLEQADHSGIQALVAELNHVYRSEPALWELDSDPAGFWWLEAGDADSNILAFVRAARDSRPLVCICNLSPVVRRNYRVGLPADARWGTRWAERLNTDSLYFGGSNVGNSGAFEADTIPWHGQPTSAALTLPPLAVLWLTPASAS